MRQSSRNWNWERDSVPPGHWKRDGVNSGDREREIRILARFTGRCDNCSEVIVQGTDLLWHPERKYRLHLWCTSFFEHWNASRDPSAGLPADWNKVTVRRAPGCGETELTATQVRNAKAPPPEPKAVEPPAKNPINTAWAEREAAKKLRYPRSGQPWSSDEERLLAQRFGQQADLEMLADKHHRTPLGIQARLVKLGLMQE